MIIDKKNEGTNENVEIIFEGRELEVERKGTVTDSMRHCRM